MKPVKYTLTTICLLVPFLMQAQVITSAMVLEQEKLCPTGYLVEDIERGVHNLDTLSLKEIKVLLKENYDYFRKNKKSIVETYDNFSSQEDSLFSAKTKNYSEEDTRTEVNENTYLKLVNNNHHMFRDTLQAGMYFEEIYKDSTLAIKMVGRNNGATVFKFASEQTIQPFYFLNGDSREELTIKNIYYHNSTEANVPFSVESYSFPLNEIRIPQMKHVDSIDMNINVKYLTKVDRVRFDKGEIGVEKMNMTLLDMKSNYVAYSAPYNYYEYHKGDILEEEFYNEKGELLSDEYALGNAGMESGEQRYKESLEYYKEINSLKKYAKNRQDIYNLLKFAELKRTNSYLRSQTVNRQLLEGNVHSMKLYLENKRDSISFDVRFRNISADKGTYVDVFEDKTEFINVEGEKLFEIPSEITFLYDLTSSSYSQHYFFILDESRNSIYYFLDRKNQKYIQLPYKQLEYLCPSLIWTMDKNNKIQLISTVEHKVMVDEKFINFRKLHYIEDSIIMYTEDGSYYLLDQNSEIIGPKTSTPITTITLKEAEY